MKKPNVCEIGCDRIVPGASDCSAPNKVEVSNERKKLGFMRAECFPFNEKYIKNASFYSFIFFEFNILSELVLYMIQRS